MESKETENDTSYVTNRGFSGYLRTMDTKGQEVRVQESSAADQDSVWIFCEHNPYEQEYIDKGGPHWCAHPHLNVWGAIDVANALQQFVNNNSQVAFLKSSQIQLLHDFYVHGFKTWVEHDEDYGYLSEQLQPCEGRLQQALQQNTAQDFRFSDDEFFLFKQLVEHSGAAVAQKLGQEAVVLDEKIKAVLDSFARIGSVQATG